MSILNPLRRFARLPSSERALLLRAGLVVAFIRLVLWTRPWPSVVRFVQVLPPLPSLGAGPFSADRLAWAVRQSSRLVPAATCLTQSLALQCALTAAGLPSSVEIGVAKEPTGEFQSHAWVEHDGHTLLSPPADVMRYTRLLTLPAPTPTQGWPLRADPGR